MVKRVILSIGLFLSFQMQVFAADGDTQPQSVQEATFQVRCLNATKMGFPECADSPAECGSKTNSQYDTGKTDNEGKSIKQPKYNTPFNCRFLQEPIGGKTGYDLYKMTNLPDKQPYYTLWYGEVLTNKEYGPFQAILAYEEGKELQGPFILLNNYLSLIYNFMSGIIVAIVILVIIVGGIRISAAGGNADSDKGGKDMIIKALIGMVLWFTASVILYTINPTFFAF